MLLPSLVGYYLEVVMWPSLMIVILPLSTKLSLESHIVSNGISLFSVHFLIQLPGNMRICLLRRNLLSVGFFLPKCNKIKYCSIWYIAEWENCFSSFVLHMCGVFPHTKQFPQCSVDTRWVFYSAVQFSHTVCLGVSTDPTGLRLSPISIHLPPTSEANHKSQLLPVLLINQL